MEVGKIKDKYLVTVTHDELLSIINGLGARQVLIRDIAGIINPVGCKAKEKELDKIHTTLAEALPPDTWENRSGKKQKQD